MKELRLRGICGIAEGNALLPEYMEDYNRRFAVPRNLFDAHRPLQDGEDLTRIFSWQEERVLSGRLTVHFKRVTYLVEPGPTTSSLGGKRVLVHEWEDGRVEILADGRSLPFSIFDQNPHVSQGAIVENKRLGAVLAVIQTAQSQRDQVRLASKKLTIRQKDRIRAKLEPEVSATTKGLPEDAVALFFQSLEEEQRERKKVQSRRAAERREKRMAELRAGLRNL